MAPKLESACKCLLEMKLGRITKVALNTPPVPIDLATSLANTVSHLTKISFVIDPMSEICVAIQNFPGT